MLPWWCERCALLLQEFLELDMEQVDKLYSALAASADEYDPYPFMMHFRLQDSDSVWHAMACAEVD